MNSFSISIWLFDSKPSEIIHLWTKTPHSNLSLIGCPIWLAGCHLVFWADIHPRDPCVQINTVNSWYNTISTIRVQTPNIFNGNCAVLLPDNFFFYTARSNLGHFETDNWDALKTQTVLKCVPFFLWRHKHCASCNTSSLTRTHLPGDNQVSAYARISWISYIMVWPRGPWTLCYNRSRLYSLKISRQYAEKCWELYPRK